MTTNTFDPHGNFREIVLVGLGGTGSALARHVARITYDMRERNLHAPEIVRFVDPDVIEQKNVGRQMFSHADIGLHKAELLARRFNRALGLKIQWHNEPFDPEKHLSREWSTILLGAVDNHLARQSLSKADAVWVDVGNHNGNSGQVVIGNTSNVERLKKPHSGDYGNRKAQSKWSYLPNAALLFPELLEPEPEEARPDLSCADLMLVGETILINDLVANIAAQYLYRLLHRLPISTFATFVDGDTLNMRSIPISRKELDGYIGQRAAG